MSVPVRCKSIVQPVPNTFCLEDGCNDSIKKPSSSQKSSKAGCHHKTKNRTNKVWANVGMSISQLCDSIAHTYEMMSSAGTRMSSTPDISQMMALQVFQSQIQNQDRKRDALEKYSRMLGKMMLKLIKSQKKSKNERKKRNRKQSKRGKRD